MSRDSDVAQDYRALDEHNKAKRQNNLKSSIALLDENFVKYEQLASHHFRVGEFDFWPSTGVYIHRASGKKARGVFNLLRAINKVESK